MSSFLKAEDFSKPPTPADIAARESAVRKKALAAALPPIETERPSRDFCFDVRRTRFDDLEVNLKMGLFTLVPFLGIVWFFVHRHAWAGAGIFLFICLMIVISMAAERRKKRAAMENPLLFSVFRQGLWLEQKQLFIPYARLVSFEVSRHSVTYGDLSPRAFIWRYLENNANLGGYRPDWREGTFAPDFIETFGTVGGLITEDCQRNGLPAPVFHFDMRQLKLFMGIS